MSDLDKARQAINDIDKKMVCLFEQRMDAVKQVAEYKVKHGTPVEDPAREEDILSKNAALIENEDYRSYYVRFLSSTIELSKSYQRQLLDETNPSYRTLTVLATNGSYNISIQRGLLNHAGEVFHLNRKVLIVTDSGVPEQYAMTVASQCEEAVLFVFDQGETAKTIDTYGSILQTLTENAFTRTDCVVAVGGGVVGDMAGFAAATYMRGIDFYNIPTTVLSQIDSSVGGKTAIDFMGYKNLVGAFYPPKGVLIDPQVLDTLPQRQVSNGLAEAVKVAMTHDAELFSMLENGSLKDAVMDNVIYRAISVKKMVVEQDEHESNLRRVLNFGHTIGHGIESISGLYHGECVALGMIPMCSESAKKRLVSLLKKLDLPTNIACKSDAVIEACRHDKKASGSTVTVVYVPEIGHFELKTMEFSEFESLAREVLDR